MKTLLPKYLLLATLGILALTSAAQAQLIYEGFDYTSGAGISGQNGGTGFTGNWTFANGGGNGTGTIVSGLTFGSLATSGNALQVVNQAADGAQLSSAYRTIGVSGSGSEFWTSYLVRLTTIPTLNSVFDARVRDGGITGTRIFQVSADGATLSTTTAGISDNGTFTSSGFTLALNTTYLMVGRFTGASTNSYTSGKMWVLSETNYANFLSAGGDVTALDANNSGNATNMFTARSLDADSDVYNLVNFAGETVTARSLIYDEVRFGTSLSSVAIPEPSTLGLLAGALVLVAVLRRRRAAKA